MNYDIFLSYANQDKAFVDALVHKLESSQIRCWYAPRDIPTGMEWAKAIPKAIKTSRLMILVFSKDSSVSSEVAKELAIASKHKRLVIPVNLDRTPLNDDMEYHLSNKHWLDVYDLKTESAIQRVESCLQDYRHLFTDNNASGGVVTTKEQPLQPAQNHKSNKAVLLKRNLPLIPMLLGLAAVLTVGVFLFTQMQSSSENVQTPPPKVSQKVEKNTTKKLDAATVYDQALALIKSKSFDKASAMLEDLVSQSYAPAEMQLANLYYDGLGVKEDKAKAVALYQRAASKGHAEAQYSLAYMYEQGLEVEKDVNKAIELYEQAAQNGYAFAMYSLGAIYESNISGSFDEQKSFGYYLDAAKANLVEAQYKVGTMYYNGIGVEKNLVEALNWLDKASILGSVEAQVLSSTIATQPINLKERE